MTIHPQMQMMTTSFPFATIHSRIWMKERYARMEHQLTTTCLEKVGFYMYFG
jgi:hypothetical protein